MTKTYGMKVLAGLALALAIGTAPASAAGDAPEIKRHTWSFAGVRGHFDQAQLQRGFQVYQEVCAACHGLKRVYFRNLSEPGGPGFPEEAIKALAASWPNQIFDGPNDQGEIITKGRLIKRRPLPSDPILGPYDNDKAAQAANNGALPPDLSVIAKARHGGAGYIYSLLNGYGEPPAGLNVNQGQHYNEYFPGDTGSQWSGDPRHKPPGGFLAMASPLEFAEVAFDDGTPSNLKQMAHDVAVYLAWAGDPKAVARKQMGTAVIPYLLILALLAFLSYRRLWRNVEH